MPQWASNHVDEIIVQYLAPDSSCRHALREYVYVGCTSYCLLSIVLKRGRGVRGDWRMT